MTCEICGVDLVEHVHLGYCVVCGKDSGTRTLCADHEDLIDLDVVE